MQKSARSGRSGGDGAGARPGSATASGPKDFQAADAEHAAVLWGLLPYVWPRQRPDLRRLIVLAFLCLLYTSPSPRDS